MVGEVKCMTWHLLHPEQGGINRGWRETVEREKCFSQGQGVAEGSKVFHAEQQHGGVCLAGLWQDKIKGFTKNWEKCSSVSGCSSFCKMSTIFVTGHNLD